MHETARKVVAGEVHAVSRLIRDIDDGDSEARAILKDLYAHTGKAYVIGITGSPGVGKSTIVDQLISHLRDADKSVGVLSVDPTSPFTGGAILGDRIRMQRHAADEGVFIRSMATRGAFGGLSHSTRSAIKVLDAMGKEFILVETVGVGQDEVDVVGCADTTIVVMPPGMGDDIQAIKAGVLEIADIFVVNKADLDGATRAVNHLKGMLDLDSAKYSDGEWKPPILMIEAVRGRGISELLAAIDQHRERGQSSGADVAREKVKEELLDVVRTALVGRCLDYLESRTDKSVEAILNGESDPYTESENLINEFVSST
jgi:LAO/AO transport system kinase